MSLDKCDPDVDIVKFINEKRTGSERPGMLCHSKLNFHLKSSSVPCSDDNFCVSLFTLFCCASELRFQKIQVL